MLKRVQHDSRSSTPFVFSSRRIDDCHRIVYKIEGEIVYIAYCGTHYHK